MSIITLFPSQKRKTPVSLLSFYVFFPVIKRNIYFFFPLPKEKLDISFSNTGKMWSLTTVFQQLLLFFLTTACCILLYPHIYIIRMLEIIIHTHLENTYNIVQQVRFHSLCLLCTSDFSWYSKPVAIRSMKNQGPLCQTLFIRPCVLNDMAYLP